MESTGYGFFAMIDRMQYINRWGLMRNSKLENIKEHSFDVAVIAHALTVIHNDMNKDKEGAIGVMCRILVFSPALDQNIIIDDQKYDQS